MPIRRIGPPVTVVKGNNDFFQRWPMEMTLERLGLSFRLIRVGLPVMRAQKQGRIISLSAIASYANHPGFSVYAGAKAP